MSEESAQGDEPSDRLAQAQKIMDNPKDYKVCEGCDSIVASSAHLCPNCHAYRFNADDAYVVEQAKLLGSREQRSVVASDFQ